MSSSLIARDFCLEETTRNTVIEENYGILRIICEKYGMKSYVWVTTNVVSIYPDWVKANLLNSVQVLKINKSKIELVDPNWEEIEKSIFTHSLSVTFL